MTAFCEYFNRGECASCAWIERPYGEQVAAKESAIQEALAFLAAPGVAPLTLEPAALSAPEEFRNRAKMTVTGTLEHPVIGLLGRGDLDDGRELLACPIHHPRLNALIAALPAFLREARAEPYRIAARAGEVKGLILFHSPRTGQTYLRFVLRSQECVSRLRKHLPALLATQPALACVSANIQPIPHAILEGPEEIFLTDRKSIEHRLGGIAFQLAPQAFAQTHVEIAERLYAAAARWVGEACVNAGPQPYRMMELFSGQGAFSLLAAEAARAAGRALEVRGVELNGAAVDAANATARAAGLANASFVCRDAALVAEELAGFAPDLLLVNPPRRGLGGALELLRRQAPRNLIYSSCNLETLASDLRALDGRYELMRAQLFDMFPHTAHFETLAWLRRRDT